MDKELLRVFFVEPLKAKNLGSELDGDWGRIKWEELKDIGRPMAEMICRLRNIPCESIVVHELLEVPVDGESQVSVSFTTNIAGLCPDAKDIQEGTQALSIYLNRVFSSECASGDLFAEGEVPEDVSQLALAHAKSFLGEKGGKRISSPIRVSGIDYEKTCSGKFAEKPKAVYTDVGRQVHRATITALSKRKQEFELLLDERKHVTITYEKDYFFWILRDRLGDEKFRTFTTHQKPLADGKSVAVLVQIDE